jgi:hypothetical protein
LFKQWNHVLDEPPQKIFLKFLFLLKILFNFLHCCGSRSTCFWASWLRINRYRYLVTGQFLPKWKFNVGTFCKFFLSLSLIFFCFNVQQTEVVTVLCTWNVGTGTKSVKVLQVFWSLLTPLWKKSFLSMD